MSRFHKLSHAIWHCQYPLVWVPKYRYRILKCRVGREVYTCIQVFVQQKGCEVVELNVQVDHGETLSGHDGFEIKSLTPISRGYLFTELFGLDHRLTASLCIFTRFPASN